MTEFSQDFISILLIFGEPFSFRELKIYKYLIFKLRKLMESSQNNEDSF